MADNIPTTWWAEGYNFFGSFYMRGDDSKDGYLMNTKQTLEERTKIEVLGVTQLLDLKPGNCVLDCPCVARISRSRF
jgi:cyclopropane fatty-acyl-phospholipid synthase-like methyltransferase